MKKKKCCVNLVESRGFLPRCYTNTRNVFETTRQAIIKGINKFLVLNSRGFFCAVQLLISFSTTLFCLTERVEYASTGI